MIFNLGAAVPVYDLTITGYPGATVTVTNGKKSYTQVTGSDGTAVFEKLKKGVYQVTAADGSEQETYEVTIGRDSSNLLNINAIPEFTYSGTYKIVNDSGAAITRAIKNWNIRFTTGGTLNISKLNGAADGIDVFCVGGGGNGGFGFMYDDNGGNFGGGGGGGGYTTTRLGLEIQANTPYTMAIGGSGGGSTSAFNQAVTAAGGSNGTSHGQWMTPNGGAGGSGGGGGSAYVATPAGGTDGGNGSRGPYTDGDGYGGQGQGRTTREFGEAGKTLYSSGGSGGGLGKMVSGNATANTGNGGNGGLCSGTVVYGTNGGSGIIVIRNKR